jgi:hypothetical protein
LNVVKDSEISNFCLKNMDAFVTVDAAVKMLQEALDLHQNEVASKSMELIIANFHQLLSRNGNSFLSHFTYDVVQQIFCHPSLMISSEWDFLQAILQYIKDNSLTVSQQEQLLNQSMLLLLINPTNNTSVLSSVCRRWCQKAL